MSANFSLNNSGDISIGTSNLNYLLGSVHEEKLRTFTPGMVHSVFGPGDERCLEHDKGYTDPEWYWQASDGCVWGIGWRWGMPRLRGRGGGRGNDRKHPDKLNAYEFVEYLTGMIDNKQQQPELRLV
jgi:hypothetical protein